MNSIHHNLVTRMACRRLLVMSIGLGLSLAIGSASAWAQAAKKQPPAAAPKKAAEKAAPAGKFKEKPEPAGFQKMPELMGARGKYQRALQEAALGPDVQKDITDYWTNVVAVQLTRVQRLALFHNADNRNPISRDNIRRELASAKPAILPFANDVALRTMAEVAAGDFHPAGRVNAMYIIGELDQQPRAAAAGGGVSPAVPFAPALSQANGLLATVENPKQHTAVRVAALLGIQRHAEAAGLPAAGQTAIRAALTKVLKEPPADPADADGNAWLRMRAATVLAGMKGGPGAEGAREIAALVSDNKAGAVARCGAASAVGQIALDASVNAAQLAGGLGNLTIEVCQREIQRAAAEGEPIASQKLQQQVGSAVKAFGTAGGKTGIVNSVKDAAAKAIVDDVAAKVGEVHALFADGATVETPGLNEKVAELKKSLQTHKLLAATADTEKTTATATDASAEPAPTPAKKAAANKPAATTK
jgi:hypothetical protein